LDIPLEWAILHHDLLVLITPSSTSNIINNFQHSDTVVLRKLAQDLVFLGLNLLENYNTPAAIELLGKSQDELLFGAFRKPHKTLSGTNFTDDEIRQIISLVRCLLEYAGGRKDFRQHRVFQFKANVNTKIYGSFIGITGSNPSREFDPQKMLSALASSELFNDEDIRALDMLDWEWIFGGGAGIVLELEDVAKSCVTTTTNHILDLTQPVGFQHFGTL
jgi:hypothetical protein